MELNHHVRATLKNEWFGSRMSDETRLDQLFDSIEKIAEPTRVNRNARITVNDGDYGFDFACDNGVWSIMMDMTEPEQLGTMLEENPRVSATFVSKPHWPCFTFQCSDFEVLLAFILKYWADI